MSLTSTCLSLLLLLLALCTYGQEQPVSRYVTGMEGAAGAQVIINEVNTDQYPQVRIFTTVLKEGTPLQGLSAADFRVREDEVDQEPLTVEPQLPPLSVVLTLDTSGSMAKRMKEAQAAAMRFLDTLGGNDSAQVVTFAREVKRLTTMSTNRQAVREAIGKTVARGDTALYDALYDSIQLVKDRTGRKTIVLLSDGVDDDGTGKPLSQHTMKEVIGSAHAVNVPIYVLGLGTDIDEAGLREIAQATGALYFKAPQASDLQALYEKIGAQLAEQYAIAYTSNLPADGTEHRVALMTQGFTDTKAYKAPDKADKAAQGQTWPSRGDALCYDETAVQSVVASLRKNEERYARDLINTTERDQHRQPRINDLNHLMTQGPDTEACLRQKLGLVHTLYNDDILNSVHENALRQRLWQALHDSLLARAQTQDEIYQALDVVNQFYEKDLINTVQREETRKALSKKCLTLSGC